MPPTKDTQTDHPSLAGKRITAVKPVRKGAWCSVKVGTRRIALIPAEDSRRLALAEGTPLDAHLLERLNRSQQRARAREAASKILTRRPTSTRRLIDRLVQRGHDRADAEHAADEMQRIGLLDDAEYARNAVRARLAKSPAGPRYLLAMLRSRGIDDETARDAVDEQTAHRDDLADAAAIAAKRLRAMRHSTDPAAAKRRVYGTLARRGFDPDTCRRAAERAINASPFADPRQTDEDDYR